MPTDPVVGQTGRDHRRQSSVDERRRGNMIRNRRFGMTGMAALSAIGLVGVIVLGSASIAAASGGGPKLSVSPSSISSSGCAAGCNMTATWSHLGQPNKNNIVLVECNFNVYSADASACNQNPDNLDQPGGPWIPTEQTVRGSGVITPESGTVGDGTCDSGQVCAIVLANVTTQEPVAGPAAFAVTP
jgi:hypothetical protein